MSNQKPKKRRILKVQVSFEVSRVSNECLAGAYEQVIPVRSRVALFRHSTTLTTLKANKGIRRKLQLF